VTISASLLADIDQIRKGRLAQLQQQQGGASGGGGQEEQRKYVSLPRY